MDKYKRWFILIKRYLGWLVSIDQYKWQDYK